MDRETIEKLIREFVIENFVVDEDEAGFANDESFLESGLIDSTGMLEVVSFVEERFSVSIADEEMVPENLDSIRSITGMVISKQAT